MNPDPRLRRGAHRTSRATSATLLPSLLALLAVTSLITALYVWRGESTRPPPAAASANSPSAHTTAGIPTSAAASVSANATTKKTTEPAAATSAAGTSQRAQTTGAQLRAGVSVVVLNETSRSGLAGTVAARLRAKGWTVGGVGNFRGAVSATTVYYPVGQLAAAEALAKNLPTAPRVLPRFGNLSTRRLTVIVAANYPG